jgi:lysozyme family protein
MPTLDQILSDVLRREGWPTVSNRPADKGGLTKGGITFTSYNAWRRLKGKDPITPTEFAKVITEEEARRFMADQIAGPLAPVEYINPDIFAMLVDWAETSGPDDPLRGLQTCLRKQGYNVTVDGLYGPATDSALRSSNKPTLYQDLIQERTEFYTLLALRDPQVKAFRIANPDTDLENLHGWILRAQSFRM